MQPPPLGLREDLDPHVVRPVERPPRVEAERAAAQREGVRPLAAPPAPRLQQLGRPGMVAREANLRRAEGTDVAANTSQKFCENSLNGISGTHPSTLPAPSDCS